MLIKFGLINQFNSVMQQATNPPLKNVLAHHKMGSV